MRIKFDCPLGRKVDLEVLPHSTILEALKQVCAKQNIDPDNYDIRHLNKLIDVDSTFQYARISNNAKLELVKRKNPRIKSIETNINVKIRHSEKKEEYVKQFLTTTSLDGILKDFGIEYEHDDKLVFVLKRIPAEEFKSTTLETLGCKGSVLFTFLKDSKQDQAGTYVPSKPKVSKTEESLESTKAELPSEYISKPSCSKDLSIDSTPTVKNEKTPEVASNIPNHPPVKPIDFMALIKSERSKHAKNEEKNFNKAQKETAEDNNVAGCSRETIREVNGINNNLEDKVELETRPFKVEVVHAERKAVLYNRADSKLVLKSFDNLPDDFFEPTVKEVIAMQRDRKKAAEQCYNQPLTTSEHKKLLKQKEKELKLKKYEKTIIRIHFPNQLVLQAVFEPNETVDDIKKFVKTYLESSDSDFTLYTIPPRTNLNPKETLVDLDLLPSANIYYSGNSDLQLQLKTKLTDSESAYLFAIQIRDSTTNTVIEDDSIVKMEVDEPIIKSEPDVKQIPQQQNQQVHHSQPLQKSQKSPTSSASSKVPKWFKSTAK